MVVNRAVRTVVCSRNREGRKQTERREKDGTVDATTQTMKQRLGGKKVTASVKQAGKRTKKAKKKQAGKVRT